MTAPPDRSLSPRETRREPAKGAASGAGSEVRRDGGPREDRSVKLHVGTGELLDRPVGAGAIPRDGIVVVDKPAGITSHGVVARVRRLAGIRRVGHAGTLDPMATGVIVLGVGRGTRLLTYMTGFDKDYRATIRLGAATTTDDAEGEVTRVAPPGAAGALSEDSVRAAVAALTGEIEQVPSAVSAIKVAGRRAYALVREGKQVELTARLVTVARFEVEELRRVAPVGPGADGVSLPERPSTRLSPDPVAPLAPGADGDSPRAGCGGRVPSRGAGAASVEFVDLDVDVTVSSGTYVRALARDLGDALGVGGHLTALRRTRVGPFRLAAARTLEELAADWRITPLAAAAAGLFPHIDLTVAEARALSRGQLISPVRETASTVVREGAGNKTTEGLVAAIGPDGLLVGLIEPHPAGARWRPVAVFTAAE